MRMWLVLGLGIVLGLATLAQAQDVGDVPMGEIGDPRRALICSRGLCRMPRYLAREDTQSEGTKVQGRGKYTGMTPTALKVWLQNANHPTMPNIMIKGQELRNLTAYILSLKD